MWTNVAILAALTLGLGQADQLTLTHPRTTYGVRGAERPDSKILPGDVIVLSFDVEGIKVDAAGKALYSIGMEVDNDKGKVLYKQAPRDLEATVPGGATSLPAAATVNVSIDQEPGEYTLKLKVTDRVSRATGELARSYEILPKAFGIVRLATTMDQAGQTPVASFRRGKSTWVNFSAVGFARNKTTGQPDVVAEMRVRDAKDRQVLARPATGEVKKDVPQKLAMLPLQFELELNRAGTYTIDLKVTDKIADKSATLSFPVTVAKSK